MHLYSPYSLVYLCGLALHLLKLHHYQLLDDNGDSSGGSSNGSSSSHFGSSSTVVGLFITLSILLVVAIVLGFVFYKTEIILRMYTSVVLNYSGRHTVDLSRECWPHNNF